MEYFILLRIHSWKHKREIAEFYERVFGMHVAKFESPGEIEYNNKYYVGADLYKRNLDMLLKLEISHDPLTYYAVCTYLQSSARLIDLEGKGSVVFVVIDGTDKDYKDIPWQYYRSMTVAEWHAEEQAADKAWRERCRRASGTDE